MNSALADSHNPNKEQNLARAQMIANMQAESLDGDGSSASVDAPPAQGVPIVHPDRESTPSLYETTEGVLETPEIK